LNAEINDAYYIIYNMKAGGVKNAITNPTSTQTTFKPEKKVENSIGVDLEDSELNKKEEEEKHGDEENQFIPQIIVKEKIRINSNKSNSKEPIKSLSSIEKHIYTESNNSESSDKNQEGEGKSHYKINWDKKASSHENPVSNSNVLATVSSEVGGGGNNSECSDKNQEYEGKPHNEFKQDKKAKSHEYYESDNNTPVTVNSKVSSEGNKFESSDKNQEYEGKLHNEFIHDKKAKSHEYHESDNNTPVTVNSKVSSESILCSFENLS